MTSHAWRSTITINAAKPDIRAMRGWLKLNAPPVPSTDADVIGKFLRATIESNAQWDGVPVQIRLPRPRPADQAPWESAESHGDRPIEAPSGHGNATPSPRAFNVLLLLISLTANGYIGISYYNLRHHPPASPISHNAAYSLGSVAQTDIARRP